MYIRQETTSRIDIIIGRVNRALKKFIIANDSRRKQSTNQLKLVSVNNLKINDLIVGTKTNNKLIGENEPILIDRIENLYLKNSNDVKVFGVVFNNTYYGYRYKQDDLVWVVR